jgi:hypothetical protein
MTCAQDDRVTRDEKVIDNGAVEVLRRAKGALLRMTSSFLCEDVAHIR